MLKRFLTPSFVRCVIAASVALVVLTCCLLVIYQGVGGYVEQQREGKRQMIEYVMGDIQKYHAQYRRWPRSLEALKVLPAVALMQEDGTIRDSWGRPFIYRLQGKNYHLLSYGRDGRPGGAGFDADISNLNLHPPQSKLPFFQVVLHPMAINMLLTALFFSTLSFILTYRNVRPREFNIIDLMILWDQACLILIASALVGAIMTFLHTPTGH